MTEMEKELVRQGWELFTRIFMKYDILEKSPVDIGTGDKFNGAQIHMIEAIGKGKGKTVTALSKYFMVTKGAISQIVSRLNKMGYITKTKRIGNDKEIILELTEKGRQAYRMHEKYNESTVSELMQLREKYTQAELLTFLSILNDLDRMLMGFVVEEKAARIN